MSDSDSDSVTSAWAVCGTVLAVLALVLLAIAVYCLKAYFANSVFDLKTDFWSLKTLLENKPLLDEENTVGISEDELSPAASNQLDLEEVEAVLQDKLPRYSVLYNGKSVDVFANVRMSQVYCIAQDYFVSSQSEAKSTAPLSSSNVGVEELGVYPLLNSKGKGQDRRRPKTIYDLPHENQNLLNEPEKKVFFPGMYLGKTIGPDGGSISIQGATLSVPVGALTVSTKICLGVVWKSDKGPKLESQQALLSSVVACEPHNLEFQVPVNLEIHHCAQMSKEWELCVMTSNTSILEEPDWKPLSTNDFKYRTFGESSVGLRLTRFSQFAVLGKATSKEVATKMVVLVPFAPPVNPEEPLIIRIYCVDDYNSNSSNREEVIRCEDELEEHSKRVHPPQPLFIRDTGADICLQIKDVPKDWSIEGDAEEDIDFNVVWQSGRPAKVFTCTRKPGHTSDQFVCTVEGFQKDQPEKRSKMRIVQRQQIPKAESIQSTIRHGIELEGGEETFPLNLRNLLIQHLEPDDILHNNDWKQVANYLKLPFREIRWLETLRGTRHGPMEYLLKIWEQEQKTRQEFKDLMKEIKRYDVLNSVKNYERLFGKGRKDLSAPPYEFAKKFHKTIRRIGLGSREEESSRPVERTHTRPMHRTVNGDPTFTKTLTHERTHTRPMHRTVNGDPTARPRYERQRSSTPVTINSSYS